MKIYLPYKDLKKSVRVLDTHRLSEGRARAKMLLGALERGKFGWYGHPECRMWRGYAPALRFLIDCMTRELIVRGKKVRATLLRPDVTVLPDAECPWWVGAGKTFEPGGPRFSLHRTHRAELYAADPTHYAVFHASATPVRMSPKGRGRDGEWYVFHDPTEL